MLSDPALEDIIFSYLRPVLLKAGYLEAEIYFGYQDGPQKEGKYVVFTIQSYADDLPPEVRTRDQEGSLNVEEIILYRADIELSVDIFGQNALLNASFIKASLHSEEAVEMAQQLKIGFHAFSDTQNLGYRYKGAYLNRCSFTLQLFYTTAFIEYAGTIGQVTVIGEDADTGKEIVNVTIKEP